MTDNDFSIWDEKTNKSVRNIFGRKDKTMKFTKIKTRIDVVLFSSLAMGDIVSIQKNISIIQL